MASKMSAIRISSRVKPLFREIADKRHLPAVTTPFYSDYQLLQTGQLCGEQLRFPAKFRMGRCKRTFSFGRHLFQLCQAGACQQCHGGTITLVSYDAKMIINRSQQSQDDTRHYGKSDHYLEECET